MANELSGPNDLNDLNGFNGLNDLNVPNGKRKARGFNYLPPGPTWVLVRGGEVL